MKLLLVVLGLFVVLGAAYSQECTGNEFFCEELDVCIPGSWICDGQNDCGDNSDEEQNCQMSSSTTACPGFVCPDNGRCLPASYICDGDKDCSDGSDEEGCPSTTSTICPGFVCPVTGRCIPSYYVCNGRNDCGDMSDETNCPTTTPRTTTPCSSFVCPNGRCIPNSYVCDGENDCSDWSDETEEACPCADNEIRCPKLDEGSLQPGACIPPEYICDEDGIWDCPDGFDESKCTKPFDATHPHFRLETIEAQKLHHMMKANRKQVLGDEFKTKRALKKKMTKWF